ncbi:MAG: TatD family hydrolase [Bacteroidetes bacterium]|jgi:TatD DNase family protein|nr:TatD family hydrolase [Bacteroidota bacterium]MBT5528438.1 TatD family hydrolase [Cytophagia bacterium]MBT3802067.1 TatD family hydrolase [Bacteroidota bacterium]MBT3933700.1 TatD family hydrolase [Bacteroidota bacterium]MBT4729128.1 TatD family hydrolase [Bacteroidota bacterium]
MFIDTHTHLFLEEFNHDRKEAVQRAIDVGVNQLILPNVDSETLPALKKMVNDFPAICHPLFGLHPGSVKENFKEELAIVREHLNDERCIGIGEIGLDFYWDDTFRKEQFEAFDTQIKWAAEKNLPIVIHLRNSYQEVIDIVRSNLQLGIKGVFHCFTGTKEEATEIIEMGFLLGIGGIVTFKNSGLSETLKHIDPANLVIETDSPYLAPVPFRGKRNESSYIVKVVEKLAEIYQLTKEEVAEITTTSAKNLFQI